MWSGPRLLNETCPMIKKLPVQRLTTQMSSHHSNLNTRLPGPILERRRLIAQWAGFGFAKNSRASRRVSKIG